MRRSVIILFSAAMLILCASAEINPAHGDDAAAPIILRSLDDAADPTTPGEVDPKLVPLTLGLVGLLAAIGLGTLVVTIVSRRKNARADA